MRPATLEELKQRLAVEHESLSKRLKEVSAFIGDNPQALALDTAAVIADKAGVHASTLVRFANHFEFHGFTELQRLFKDHLHENYNDYGERIRLWQQSPNYGDMDGANNSDDVTPAQLLEEFTQASLYSLEDLSKQVDPTRLNQAVALLAASQTIYLCGLRRAFPVSMYFAYALNNIQIKCQAISGMGMMHEEQVSSITTGDTLIAITYSPYSEITQSVIRTAHNNGAKIILIKGVSSCPAESMAEITFTVEDAEVRSFRSLTSSMCLAQTLCIALGYRREKNTPDQINNQVENTASEL